MPVWDCLTSTSAIALTGRAVTLGRGLKEQREESAAAGPTPTQDQNNRLRTGTLLTLQTREFSFPNRYERLLCDSEQWRRLHAVLPSLRLRLYRISHHCREDGT